MILVGTRVIPWLMRLRAMRIPQVYALTQMVHRRQVFFPALIQELFAFYEAELSGETASLPPMPSRRRSCDWRPPPPWAASACVWTAVMSP